MPKVSVVMNTGIMPKDVHFSSVRAMESTMDEVSARKKKFKGFPLFFIFENFKQPYFMI
jgi:hypothetical protein